MQKEQIAQKILKDCFWGNTNLTSHEILSRINDYDFAKQVFSAIFENSKDMVLMLSLIKKEWVKEFIKKQKIGRFKQDFLQQRLDALNCIYIDNTHQIKGRSWKI